MKSWREVFQVKSWQIQNARYEHPNTPIEGTITIPVKGIIEDFATNDEGGQKQLRVSWENTSKNVGFELTKLIVRQLPPNIKNEDDTWYASGSWDENGLNNAFRNYK